MSSDPSSPLSDPRARLWGRLAIGAGVLGVGFLVAPMVYTAITGLVGLIAAGAIMGTTWMLLPWAQTKAANLRMKLVTAEAAANPIDTLNAEHLRQSEALDERRKGIEVMSGANRTLMETIRELEREFPDSPELVQMKADHAELKALEEARRQDWQDAYVTLGEFAKEIKRVAGVWKVAQAAAKARGASGLSQDEWMATLKSDAAFAAVRTKLNTELSALSTERMQADADRLLKGKLAAKAAPKASMVNSDVAPAQRTATRQTIG